MIKNVIFDMDGVLLDSEEAIREACVRMFKGLGATVSADDFVPFTGMGENRFIGGVAEKYGLQFKPEMKAEAYRIYGEIAAEYVKVYDGIKELVQTLKSLGFKVAVASAADEVKVKINLRCIGLLPEDFGGIITGSDVTKHKPDPQAFLMACEKLGGKPDESVVVEDAVAGCRAAKAAGMACIGVTSTFDEAALKNAGADFIVQKTADMLAIMQKL